jgi:hypothetical protein
MSTAREPAYGTTATSVPRGPTAQLTAVRVGHHEGFDRLVFDFSGGPPGYRVEYARTPVTQQGSGRPVHVDGKVALKLTMSRASGVIVTSNGVQHTYAGPTRFHPERTIFEEVVRTGDYEANLGWAVGLPGRLPFRVFTLDGPSRVVVDVWRKTTDPA